MENALIEPETKSSGWDTFEGNKFNLWIKQKQTKFATVRKVEAIIHDWKSKWTFYCFLKCTL